MNKPWWSQKEESSRRPERYFWLVVVSLLAMIVWLAFSSCDSTKGFAKAKKPHPAPTGTPTPHPTPTPPPNSTITAPVGNQGIIAGQSITFAGSGTDPSVLYPLTYLWDFDFANSGISDSTAQNPGAVRFDRSGTFPIKFTVKNASGISDPKSARLKIAVAPSPSPSPTPPPTPTPPPVGTITAPTSNVGIFVGSSVSFSGDATDPSGLLPFTWHWTFGTGSGIADSTAKNPGPKTFNNIGDFTVTFTPTNSSGIPDAVPPTRIISVAATPTPTPTGTPTPTPTATPTPTPGLRSADIIKTYGRLVIPSTGIYWGAEDQNTNFTGTGGIETAAVLNRFMSVRRKSYDFTGSGPPTNLPTSFETDNANHTSPHIIVAINQGYSGTKTSGAPVKFTAASKGGPNQVYGWDSTNTTAGLNGKTGIDRITEGEWDSTFTTMFNNLKALPGPVIYMLFKEFNGNEHNQCAEANGVHSETLWTRGTGETAFVNAYRHIRNLANAAGASISTGGNVIFVWATQGANTQGYFENYYPGDDYVDFLGHDLYRGTVSHDLNTAVPQRGSGDNLMYKFAQGTHVGSAAVGRVEGVVKPMMICEAGFDNAVDYPDDGIGGTGFNYRKDSDSGHGSIQAKTLDDLRLRYPNIPVYVHWNVSGTSTPTHYNKVDQSPASLGFYKTFVNDPYCNLFYTP